MASKFHNHKTAKSELTLNYIKGVKKAWKGMKNRFERDGNDAETSHQILREMGEYINRLHGDLVINKGFWHFKHDPDDKGFEKIREKVMDEMREVKNMAMAFDFILRKGPDKYDQYAEMVGIQQEINDIDRALSRRLFPALKRALKKHETLDLGSHVPSKIDVKGLKVVFQDGADEKHPFDFDGIGDVKHPRTRKKYVKALHEVHSRLNQKGFDHLWYGDFIIHVPSDGKMPDGSFGNAKYELSKDTVHYYAKPSDHTPYSIVHELGHRHWYKFMSTRDRQAFSAYFETGEVDPVTEYGGTMAEEDFAEVFAHVVMDKNIGDDQFKRFKKFFGGDVRTSHEKIATRIASRIQKESRLGQTKEMDIPLFELLKK